MLLATFSHPTNSWERKRANYDVTAQLELVQNYRASLATSAEGHTFKWYIYTYNCRSVKLKEKNIHRYKFKNIT